MAEPHSWPLGRRRNTHTPWRKDACLLEDKTRSRNPTLVGALAMLRNTFLLMFKENDEHSTLPDFVESIADNNKAFSMLMRRF
jgi:hypothetical protein